MIGFHPRSSSENLWRWNGARLFFFYDRIFFKQNLFFNLQQDVRQHFIPATGGNRRSEGELRITIASGTRTGFLLAGFLNSAACGEGGLPSGFRFSLLASVSLCFCLNALSRPSPWPASWAASQAASCHRRSRTWHLSPLPPSLPRETCLTHTPEDFKVRSPSITALDFSKAAF